MNPEQELDNAVAELNKISFWGAWLQSAKYKLAVKEFLRCCRRVSQYLMHAAMSEEEDVRLTKKLQDIEAKYQNVIRADSLASRSKR